jgi:hypothetical protein
MRKSSILVSFLVQSLALGNFALAQEFRGTIAGRVADPSGGVIPGANVTVTAVETAQVTKMLTNEAGQYVAALLPVGKYRLEVEMAGFKKFVQDNIGLRVNDRLQIDVKMELGAQNQVVTVTAGAPLLNTSDASAGLIVDTRRLMELPIAHGNPYLLIGLSPGTSMDGDQKLNRPFEPTHIVAYAMDGARANTSDVTLDGVVNTALANPGQITASYVPPSDAVSEFKVQTASFDAKVGQTLGGVVNISLKSGTNSPHGTAFYTKMTPEMTANDWFANRSGIARSDEKYDRYGTSLTGPVFLPKLYNGRERTFFMYAYEGMKDVRPRGDTYTVPTLAERKGDFSELLALGSKYQIYNPLTRRAVGSRYQADPFVGNIIPPDMLNPIAVKILTYVPPPLNSGTTADHQNNLPRPNLAEDTDYYTHVFRIDHAFSPRNHFFVRGNVYKRDSISKDYYQSNATGQKQDYLSRGGSFDDVHAFTPTFIMNLRYGYNRFIRLTVPQSGFNLDLTALGFPAALNNAISPDQRMFPYVRVRDSGTVDSVASQNIGEQRYMDTHSIVAAFTKIRGTHQLEFGTEFRAYRHNRYNINSTMSGSYTFDTTYTKGPLDNATAAPMGQGMAAFLLGIPTAGSGSFLRLVSNFAEQSTAWGFYVQDNWRLTPKLNLTLGLRYELETPVAERYNRSVRGFDPTAVLAESAQAAANYAAAYAQYPTPELPAVQFKALGGLLFAGVNGQPTRLWNLDKNNFMPRIGVAYSWNNKTVIRGGYGIYYASMGVRRTDVIQNGYARNTPFTATSNNLPPFNTLSNPFPNGLLPTVGSSLGVETDLGENITFFNTNPLAPKMQRWQIGIQRQLPLQTVMEVSYVGNKGTELQPSNSTSGGALPHDLNAIPNQYLSTLTTRDQAKIDYLSLQITNPFYKLFPGTIANSSKVTRGSLLKPYPQFGTIYSSDNNGYSWYHAMQVRLDKRFTQGLTSNFAYTWSKVMEAVDYQNPGDPLPYYCVSPQDHTHRISASGIYELPFGRGRKFFAAVNRVVDGFLGGWQLQAVYTYQTGAPVTWSSLNIVYSGNLKDIASDARDVDQWFNLAGFLRDSTQQPSSTYQLSKWPIRLNGVRIDGINNWDISLMKVFRVREGVRFQLRGEALNAMNHPSFRTPATNPYNLDFGKVTDTAAFGRTVQASLKFVF